MQPLEPAHRVGAVDGFPDDLDVGLGVEDHAEPAPHQRLVVGDQHADRARGGLAHDADPSPNGSRTRTENPPPGLAPVSSEPP
jgi:hypothetical protein